MKPEFKPLSAAEKCTESRSVLRQITNFKLLIESPEYFYQQPTPEQEKKFKEDYEDSWHKLSQEENIHVPKTIGTYFGKVEFIQDELNFREFCNAKYQSSNQAYQDFKDRLVDYRWLHEKRKEAFVKLNWLSPEEITKLKAKTTNIPLQVIYLPTGNLVRFPLH